MALVFRLVKGSGLTNAEIDDNFKYLESVAAVKGDTYTVVDADGSDTLLVDPAGGAFTINLTAAATLTDSFRVSIINIGATGTVTIDPSGAETINGAATLVLSNQYDVVTLQSTGTTWYVVSESFAADVTSTAVITDNVLVRGDGGARGIQETGITVADTTNNMSGVGTIGSGAITSSGAVQGTSLTDGTATMTGGAITGLTTPLTVPQGGSGVATLTDHGVVLGSGAGAVSVTDAGDAGEILVSGGASADPDWAFPKHVFMFQSNTDLLFNTTVYTSVSGSGAGLSGGTSTVESAMTQIMPIGGNLKNLYARCQINGLDGDTIFTLRVNGVSTALTVTIGAGVAGVNVSDLVNKVAVSAGDRIAFQIDTTASTASFMGQFKLSCMLE